MMDSLEEFFKICQRHSDRLSWSISYLSKYYPFSADTLEELDDTELAILDQFSTRYSKLQDLMGAKLFPAILELVKEQGDLNTFLDKVNRLEKIGAIPSADHWLLMREMRNAFSHEYPDDTELQSATINKAIILARDLLAVLVGLDDFCSRYR